ncbi:MAG: DUF4065 domain-containing protein [Candidatus Berkelbacteria bacterium]|nr:DUF4065 domain-containing protein [Candidatus Berkelbacteria bacterium]
MNYFKKLLLEKKISHEKLADIFGISRPTAAKIANGDKEMTITELRRLAEVLGISVDEVLGEKTSEIVLECPKEKAKPTERISVPAEDAEKFKNVLLYITQKIGALPNVGQTVLYKILYFCDFDYYEKFEEQLTGARYIRNHYGPTPVAFAKIVKTMITAGEIEEVKTKYFNKEQTKYIPVIEPNLSVLSGQELKHIDEEIEKLGGMTATELSNLSHKDVPWIVTKEGDEIPYETAFYRTPDTSVRDYDDSL